MMLGIPRGRYLITRSKGRRIQGVETLRPISRQFRKGIPFRSTKALVSRDSKRRASAQSRVSVLES
jgi:hypothetical protein